MTGDDLVKLFGVPPGLAPTMADHLDEVMGASILAIYRSAAQPALRELVEELATASRRPALLIHATEDPYVPPQLVFDVAKGTGAQILTLEGRQHWWMWEDPRGRGDRPRQVLAGPVGFPAIVNGSTRSPKLRPTVD